MRFLYRRQRSTQFEKTKLILVRLPNEAAFIWHIIPERVLNSGKESCLFWKIRFAHSINSKNACSSHRIVISRYVMCRQKNKIKIKHSPLLGFHMKGEVNAIMIKICIKVLCREPCEIILSRYNSYYAICRLVKFCKCLKCVSSPLGVALFV